MSGLGRPENTEKAAKRVRERVIEGRGRERRGKTRARDGVSCNH